MDRLQAMRVFEKVVNEGGFAAAARALDMSPPVVTRLVAELEDHLGTRLLQRTTRRMSLTEAGQAYLLRVRSILQDVDEADALATSHTQEMAGLLRLHAPPVMATYVLAPLLARFRRLHPGVTIEVDVESVKELPIEDYDLTLFGGDDSVDADVVARKVVESVAILVASPEYVRLHGLPSTPQDLAQHACLKLRTPSSRSRVWRLWNPEDPAQPTEVEVQPVLLANHTDTLLRSALDGAGITSIAVELVAEQLERGELVRALAPWITGRLSVYAALPSRKFIPQRTRSFLEFLVSETQARNDQALAACTGCGSH
jgi:DNA-binding transcriptional LysR family regulator